MSLKAASWSLTLTKSDPLPLTVTGPWRLSRPLARPGLPTLIMSLPPPLTVSAPVVRLMFTVSLAPRFRTVVPASTSWTFSVLWPAPR